MISCDVRYIGILNVTPDSFSDGGSFLDVEASVAHGEELIRHGAALLDIGGDSTRPGSQCVGVEEEWRRIYPVLSKLSTRIPVSVDTHHPEVARRALSEGAAVINDVSGGSYEMFRAVALESAKIIVMYSRCSRPHLFDRSRPSDLIADIRSRFLRARDEARSAGLSDEQVLFDPGMGGFLSEDPNDSFLLLRNLDLLREFFPLVLGISRKGFLRAIADVAARERDYTSALVAKTACARLQASDTLYLRVHSITVHTQLINS